MKEEFQRVYNINKDAVLRLAYSYTRKLSDAEDITQNVFIKLYKNINNFRDDNHLKKWLMTVTANECKNYFLSYWYRKILPLEDHFVHSNFTINNSDSNLQEALFNLPTKERIIIYFYYYEGYKVKEIATILKMNSHSVQTKLNRARKKLKDILKGEWEDEK